MYTRAQWIYHARVCEYVRESVRICTHAFSEYVTRVCVDLYMAVCECVHMCGVKCCVCVGERVESSMYIRVKRKHYVRVFEYVYEGV